MTQGGGTPSQAIQFNGREMNGNNGKIKTGKMDTTDYVVTYAQRPDVQHSDLAGKIERGEQDEGHKQAATHWQ